MYTVGVVFAIVALVSWTFGDFFIQRVTRHTGTIRTLFYIAAIGAVGLFPFAWAHLGELVYGNNLWLLGLAVCVTFFAAVFDFEALHDGKLAVVEPVLALELPLVVLMAVILHGETLDLRQVILIAFIFIGIVFAVTARRFHWHRRIILEKGFLMAGIGAVALALTSFLYGVTSQQTSAVLTVWFVHTALAVICLVILARRRAIGTLFTDFKKWWLIILIMSVADNAAWLAYSEAARLIPISIATTIADVYVVMDVILGVKINREKLKGHQIVGIALALIGLIGLSMFSN